MAVYVIKKVTPQSNLNFRFWEEDGILILVVSDEVATDEKMVEYYEKWKTRSKENNGIQKTKYLADDLRTPDSV